MMRKPASIDWVFCTISRKKYFDMHICERNINNIIIKPIVQLKGPCPGDQEIKRHSLPVVAAEDLMIKGHDTAAIMRVGGWRSLNLLRGYLNQAEHSV